MQVNEEGRTWLSKNMVGPDGFSEYAVHVDDRVFERTVHGLRITQHICPVTKHGVILVEGILFDSDDIGPEEGKNAEEMAEYGFRIFEEDGFNNLVHFYPGLKPFLEGSPEELESIGTAPKGIAVVNFDDYVQKVINERPLDDLVKEFEKYREDD